MRHRTCLLDPPAAFAMFDTCRTQTADCISLAVTTPIVVVSDASLAIGDVSVVNIAFSEMFSGFTNADPTVTNGRLCAVTLTNGGLIWTATITLVSGFIDPPT